MKRFAKLLILSLVLSLNLIYCAGTKKAGPASQQVPEERQQSKIIEDFDPETLDEYDVDVSMLSKGNAEATDIDQILSGNRGTLAPEAREIPGYRVQLISTRDEEEARAIKRDALLIFDEDVYLTFDDPYYKVRVGDCTSRYEAEELQQEAIKKGFLDAWVVRTKIANPAVLDSQPGSEGGSRGGEQK